MSIVALSSVPVLSFGIAQVATSGNAFAAGKTTTCSGGAQTVTFAAPGLSTSGSAQKSKNSTANTSAASSTTCTGAKPGSGTVAGNSITTTSTTKCSKASNPPAGCTGNPKFWVYDSAAQFATGASTLYKAVPTTTFTDNGTTYKIANTKSAQATTCPGTEVGFKLTGTLTAPASQKGKATTITACLNTDTGTDTTGNFKNDVTTEVLNGDPSMVITSASFDPASSSIVFK
jgi:hypothetical protein